MKTEKKNTHRLTIGPSPITLPMANLKLAQTAATLVVARSGRNNAMAFSMMRRGWKNEHPVRVTAFICHYVKWPDSDSHRPNNGILVTRVFCSSTRLSAEPSLALKEPYWPFQCPIRKVQPEILRSRVDVKLVTAAKTYCPCRALVCHLFRLPCMPTLLKVVRSTK